MTQSTTVGSTRTYGVMIVDDDDDVRDVLERALSRAGFRVCLASDGREALDVYDRHGTAINVVLMDVCMPEVDGPQTLAALRLVAPQIRCCFMSGNFGPYTEKGLRDLGAAAVLAKPFRITEVIEVLGKVAASKRRMVRSRTAAGA